MKRPKRHIDQFDLDAENEASAIRGMIQANQNINGRARKRRGNSRGGKIAMPTASGGGHDYTRIRLQKV